MIKIKDLKLLTGLSMDELEKLAGTTRKYLAYRPDWQIDRLKACQVRKIAQFLNMSTDDLLDIESIETIYKIHRK